MKGDAIVTPSSLVHFWSEFRLGMSTNVHPQDLELLNSWKLDSEVHVSVEQYVNSDVFGHDGSTLQLGLTPAPYSGDLSKADIFILMLNPSFSIVDLFGEYDMPEFKQAVEKTLRQDLQDEEFPFVYLNPKFCWSGAYQWWEPKVRDVALELAKQQNLRYIDALKAVSQHIACIELIPYHCVSGPNRKLERLPSAKAAYRYVRDELLPRARAGEITVIATRKIVNWGLSVSDESENVVVYSGGRERLASLSMNSAGGQAILKRLAS